MEKQQENESGLRCTTKRKTALMLNILKGKSQHRKLHARMG